MTDATWLSHPGTNDFHTGANWSGGTVPDGTALFGASSVHGLTFSDVTTVGGWTFKPDASDYAFNIPGGIFVEFTGAGELSKI